MVLFNCSLLHLYFISF